MDKEVEFDSGEVDVQCATGACLSTYSPGSVDLGIARSILYWKREASSQVLTGLGIF